jgi:predicted nucleotidyltransferase
MTRDYQAIIERFVAACAADERVIAAALYGSRAWGAEDEHSDLDLAVITTDEAYDDVIAGRAEFARSLGEPLFVEDFDLPFVLFAIYAGGEEVEFTFLRQGAQRLGHEGPFVALLDKAGILAGPALGRRLRRGRNRPRPCAARSTGSGTTSRTSGNRSPPTHGGVSRSSSVA